MRLSAICKYAHVTHQHSVKKMDVFISSPAV